MESWLFLFSILVIAFLGKNQSLMIACFVVLLLKAIPNTAQLFDIISKQGINWGVTVISVAILIPIATGKIGFMDLINSFKSPVGWIAIACGVLVSILSARGVGFLAASPEVTVALVFGTIMGVVFLNGIAAGPVIASGIAYLIIQMLQIQVK
ncbi:DUF441 domain-containing protein [Pediococcus argentinicus]|uniref:UPF0756 membrane protein IV88_GL000060 n=1 Tax=Pediococcus argentinicus TaxID=480391 RepID=A0A0R2NQU4_9LACO|nr:DUF441 domain-containing protein [Pediococcus argentinicus]KRO26275.1 integral membrane protein [Pediococcus argentinicus]NKZ21533.1 DUF441 domain-containing protein [Pediococcus argentinicus]GEP18668.1 UPF0756 membrane protein [Pediococcus argentinicus]